MKKKFKVLALFTLLCTLLMSTAVFAEDTSKNLLNQDLRLKAYWDPNRDLMTMTLSSDCDLKFTVDVTEKGDYNLDSIMVEVLDTNQSLVSLLKLNEDLNTGHAYIPAGRYYLSVSATDGSGSYPDGEIATPVVVNLKIDKYELSSFDVTPTFTSSKVTKNAVKGTFTYLTSDQCDNAFSGDRISYICQIADNKSMMDADKVVKWGNAVTFKNLKSNKTYYVRVRAEVPLESGDVVYSPWSRIVKVKTTK